MNAGDDLITFLNARLDEDEATATIAASVAGPDWRYEQNFDLDPAATWLIGKPGSFLGVTLRTDDEETAPFVTRNDPARVLREVAVKRAIIATVFAYEAKIDGEWACCHSAGEIAGGYCPETRPDDIRALRELAAVYSDHPDYQEDWKP